MYIVEIEDTCAEYFNEKENAIKRAKELYNDCIYTDPFSGSIEKFEEEYETNYEDIMKEIETGYYRDDWLVIHKIVTED